MKLSFRDWSDYMRSMIKTRHDNDMMDHIGAVYTKMEIELLWLIGSSVVCDEN